ncbi:MAG: hypothetical protein LBT82_04130 [Oscillospiraceae bacterium]|jgi:hypothetical protein|nr:hypothetical protein [Oscillospiraceae bacterium]
MKTKNKYEFFSIFIFCGFLLFFFLLIIVNPKKEFSENEKRKLATPPKINLNTIKNSSLGVEIEKYFSDHFFNREFFIGTFSYANLAIGRNGQSGIYKGKDDYLIEKPAKNNEQNFIKNIKTINKFIESFEKINAKIMLVPTTGFIMENKLPLLHETYQDDFTFKILEKEVKGKINNIDLIKTFKDNCNNKQIFYKTDHHWTYHGAFLAYKKYCEECKITYIDEKNFLYNNFGYFWGTTYSKSALWLSKPDIMETLTPKDSNNFKVIVKDLAEEKIHNGLLFEEYFNKNNDKYSIFTGSNNGFTIVENNSINNSTSTDKSLLIIKDSFANSLVPFLINHYKKIYLLDPRYYKKSISNIIRQDKIQNILILYSVKNIAADTNIVLIK